MNVDEEARNMVRRLIRHLNAQIAGAKANGADERDCCITLPVGYMALASGMPLIELDGKLKALAPMRAAEGMVRTLEAESGWGP